MGKKHHKKKGKTKDVSDEVERVIKKDIPILESRKAEIIAEAKQKMEGKKGIGKFLTRLSYGSKIAGLNLSIGERKQYGVNKVKIGVLKQKVEISKLNKELKESKQNVIESIKPISTKDIFG